jgi:hypothetical protein
MVARIGTALAGQTPRTRSALAARPYTAADGTHTARECAQRRGIETY